MHFLLKKKGKKGKKKTLPQTEPQKLPPALLPTPLRTPSFLGLCTKAIGAVVQESLLPLYQLQALCVGTSEGTSTTHLPRPVPGRC